MKYRNINFRYTLEQREVKVKVEVNVTTLHFTPARQAATGHQSRGPSWETEMTTAAQDSWARGTLIDLHRHTKGRQEADGATDVHRVVNKKDSYLTVTCTNMPHKIKK